MCRDAGKKSSSKRSKRKDNKKGHTNGKVAAVAPEDEDEQSVDNCTPKPVSLFTTENIKQLTKYVSNGFLTRFRLYKCVLNQTVSSSSHK